MTDDETTVGEQYSVTADISNIGGAQATQTITLDVDGTTEDSTDLSLNGQSGGTPPVQTVTLSYVPVTTGTKTLTVASADDSESRTLDVQAAGAVITPTIQTTNSPVALGETLRVTTEVTNTSSVSGGTIVALEISDGVGVVESQAEFLTAGGSRTVTLSWDVPSNQAKQDYQATIKTDDGSDSTTVTVGGKFLLTLDSLTFVEPATFDVSVSSTTSPVNPGNTVDVTADITNTGDETGTQNITLDIDNGVGQVDSQSVTLSGGGSTTQTLSWSVPSNQTEQDYQATVASADDTASQTVTVTSGSGLTIDGFESYSTGPVPSQYNDVNTNSNAGVVTTSANSGSQSLNIQGPTGLGGFDPTIKKTFSAGTPDTIQVTYYETSGPTGGAIRWLDSSGEELCAVGSGNPQAQAVYGNDSAVVLESNPSPDYETWRRFTITPDFGNGSFDVLWEDIGGSTGDRSQTGLAFVGSPSDVAEIQFGGDKRPSAAMGANGIGGTFLVDDSSSL